MPNKLSQNIVVLAEVILGLTVVIGLVISRPTDPVYWIAFIIEVGLGFLSYRVIEWSISNQYNKWLGFLGFLLTIVGIAGPIILYNTVEFLKPAGSTWLIYSLSLNSFYLYRIKKKGPIPQKDISSGKLFTRTKVMHWIFFSLITIILIVIVILAVLGNIPVLGKATIAHALCIIIGIPFLFLGFRIPRIIRWFWKDEKAEFYIYSIYAARASAFITIAILGLILGIADGLFPGPLPLILAAGIAMLFAVPNENGWNKYLDELGEKG